MDPGVAHERPGAVVRRDIAVVGASAGGVEALASLARAMPSALPMAIVVVLHMPSDANSRLPEILSRVGPLPASFAQHGVSPAPGTILIAPPDHHVVFSGDRTYLLDGPRENGFRPAIDPLFRSAARELGPRVVGVILSGTMDDGAAGLAAVRSFGGATVVQDPDDALASGMPRAAIEAAGPDHIVPATAIADILAELAAAEVPVPADAGNGHLRPVGPGGAMGVPRGIQAADPTLVADPMQLPPHGVDLACPECGGALQEVLAGTFPRFRCRTGHIYSSGTLLETKSVELEGALYAALRALEEEASIAGRMVAKSRDAGATAAMRRFEQRQGDAAGRADLVRQALHSMGNGGDAEETLVSPISVGERGGGSVKA